MDKFCVNVCVLRTQKLYKQNMRHLQIPFYCVPHKPHHAVTVALNHIRPEFARGLQCLPAKKRRLKFPERMVPCPWQKNHFCALNQVRVWRADHHLVPAPDKFPYQVPGVNLAPARIAENACKVKNLHECKASNKAFFLELLRRLLKVVNSFYVLAQLYYLFHT